jgi:Coenzyme PQQ synthesis protein D (PqqD)
VGPSAQIKPYRRPGVIHYEAADEIVVYCPATSQAASLNESARAIWELCDGTRTIDDICTELAQWTTLPATQLRDDVLNAIDRLCALDLLTSDCP